MKNILLYTDTPQIGGAELQMFLLAKFLDRTKFIPILTCGNSPALDKWCAKFEREDIKVLRLKVHHKHDPRHLFQLRKIIKEENISVLHAHVWNPASCRYAYSAASSTKTPLVITEHDPFKLNFFKAFFKKHSLKNVSKIITVSEENSKVIKKLYPSQSHKVAVIHNGLDLNWWQSQLLRFTDEDRNIIKENIFQSGKDTLIILTLAELHERKGLRYLIEAMPEVVAKYLNVKLAIVGEGGERKKLEKLIEKLRLSGHVILTGRQKEVPKLLKSANIFVLPSLREAFGFVLTEAMITPLPVIASKVGGISEVVEDGKTGLLVPPANPAALSRALLKLISSESQRRKLAEAGFKRVTENFDAKKMAEQYGKIYNSIK